MVQSISYPQVQQWVTVCALDHIWANTGVCALVDNRQVAVFHWRSPEDLISTVYAIDNYDPFSQAYVLARGLVGDRNGTPKVASPIYKQNFNLQTGQCFDDPSVKVNTYPARITNGLVQVGIRD
jgi:nitrite reductase (NADH) small subunit